jgi:hypothetical protein
VGHAGSTGEAGGARLIGNAAGDCLANPPSGVGGKLVAAAVLELVHRLHQVGFDELLFGVLRVCLSLDDLALVRCNCWNVAPASLSSLSKAARFCRCFFRQSFLSSSLRVLSIFFSFSRLRSWRSSEHMISTVLFNQSIKRYLEV